MVDATDRAKGTSIGRLLPLSDAPTLCCAGPPVSAPHCLSDVGRNSAPARPGTTAAVGWSRFAIVTWPGGAW